MEAKTFGLTPFMAVAIAHLRAPEEVGRAAAAGMRGPAMGKPQPGGICPSGMLAGEPGSASPAFSFSS